MARGKPLAVNMAKMEYWEGYTAKELETIRQAVTESLETVAKRERESLIGEAKRILELLQVKLPKELQDSQG